MWEQLIPAGLSLVGSLLGGDDNDDAPTSVREQKRVVDPGVQAALGQYQNYITGLDPNIQFGRLPGLSPLQQMQMGQAAGMAAGTPGYFNTAQQAMQGAMTPLEQRAGQLMNPYTQNVLNEQMRLSNQNLFENVMPQVNTTFTGTGQFGSTRNADFMNRAIRDQQYNLAGQMGNTLMGAQNAANQLAMGDLQRQQGLAGQAFNQGMTGLGALGQIGGVQRQESTGGVQDIMYQDQGKQQNWANQLAKGQGLLAGVGAANQALGGTTVETMYGANPSQAMNPGGAAAQGWLGGLASFAQPWLTSNLGGRTAGGHGYGSGPVGYSDASSMWS